MIYIGRSGEATHDSKAKGNLRNPPCSPVRVPKEVAQKLGTVDASQLSPKAGSSTQQQDIESSKEGGK